MFGHNKNEDNDKSNDNQHADPVMMQEPPTLNSDLGSTGTTSVTTSPHDDDTAPQAPPTSSSLESIQPSKPLTTTDSAADSPSQDTPDDLLDLKHQALQQLAPLVDQLDQTPQEKFHTTMMMIQATDNRALLPEAYQTAQTITDDKTRAQALLDVINEINYFTQNDAS